MDISAVLGVLRSRWLHYGLLVLAVLFYRHDARSWHNAFDAQKNATSAASAAATAKAERQRVETIVKTAELAERADHATETADRLRAAADDFRLRQIAARRSGPAPAAPADRTAEDRDRPRDLAVDDVCVPGTDYQTLTDNTARLWRVRNEWALPAIKSGAAIPEVDFAKEVSQPARDH